MEGLSTQSGRIHELSAKVQLAVAAGSESLKPPVPAATNPVSAAQQSRMHELVDMLAALQLSVQALKAAETPSTGLTAIAKPKRAALTAIDINDATR